MQKKTKMRLRDRRDHARSTQRLFTAWMREYCEDHEWDPTSPVGDLLASYMINSIRRAPAAAGPAAVAAASRAVVGGGQDTTVGLGRASLLLGFMLAWSANGTPVFKLDDDLLLMMLHTACENVPLDQVKLPFSAFTIDLGDTSRLSYISVKTGERVPVRFLGVLRSKHRSEAAAAARKNHGRMLAREACLEMIQQATEENVFMFATNADSSHGEVHRLEPYDGRSTTEYSASVATSPPAAPDLLLVGMTNEDDTCVALAWRVVLNMCLYVAQLRREKVKIETHQSRKGKGPVERSYILHAPQSVTLSAQMLRDATPKTGSAGWKVRQRFIVRGHWRNQPCGLGGSERKLTWIEPHWKGPKDGPELPREYQVET